jgi:hypothetical protein
MYFPIPEIQGFPKICILPRFEKHFCRDFSRDVMAPLAAWASPISGSRSNFKNSFCYFSNYIKKMCHRKFQGLTTFLLGCRGGGGPQIGQSFSTIKGQTVVVIIRYNLSLHKFKLIWGLLGL